MSLGFENYNIWDALALEKRPIILYGTGNGADKIIAACDLYGIKISGVFASDGFVRDRTFHGMKVYSYSRAIHEYGDDIVILLAFGSNRPEVVKFIYELNSRHTLIIPEVPLYGGSVFDKRHFDETYEEYQKVLALLHDEESTDLFYDAVNFRMTGNLKYLERCEDFSVSLENLLKNLNIRVAVDGGAYKGDTLNHMINSLSDIEKVYAVEPDPKTFLKLAEYSSSISDCTVIPANFALSDKIENVTYVSSASRGSAIEGKNKRSKEVCVSCTTIDELVGEERVDLIKLDVEGAEIKALNGAVNTILKNSPALIVSLYHRTDDLKDIISYVHDLCPNHSFYLRRPFCIPMWDLNLYAVPN